MQKEKSIRNAGRYIPLMEEDVTSYLSHRGVDSRKVLGTRAIITDSYTGRTARYIASFRGSNPTVALCYHQHVIRLLALSYGVFPFYQPKTQTSREYFRHGLEQLIKWGLITKEDTIAYLGGGFGEGRGTTFLEINKVGEVMENYENYNLPNLENNVK